MDGGSINIIQKFLKLQYGEKIAYFSIFVNDWRYFFLSQCVRVRGYSTAATFIRGQKELSTLKRSILEWRLEADRPHWRLPHKILQWAIVELVFFLVMATIPPLLSSSFKWPHYIVYVSCPPLFLKVCR